MTSIREFECGSCGHTWKEPYGTGRPAGCPSCGSADIYRIDSERGGGRGRCIRQAGPRGPSEGGRGRDGRRTRN